jgi:hypothetical protein
MARRGFGAARGQVDLDDAERERLDRALVSDLRRAAARYPDDPGLRRLVDDLRATSPDFARLWALRELDGRHDDVKRVQHPELGVLVLECTTPEVSGDDQRLLVYSAPPGTPEADALALLRVVGLQRMGGEPAPTSSTLAQQYT